MGLHLVKLCVGIETVDDLRQRQAGRLAQKAKNGEPQELLHITRMTPRRSAELLDGGSLYWVIKRQIRARQSIIELRPIKSDDGIKRCAIVLGPELILTANRGRRPFQGWRYLTQADAPPDAQTQNGDSVEDFPAELRAALMELGLL